MKKIIFTIGIVFILIGNVNAQTVEQELKELRNSIDALEERMTNLETTRLDKMYPIGSIYITNTYSSAAAVSSAIGGTWETYGNGRTLVGVNSGDSNFNTVNKTGGVSSVNLTTANLPSHTHSIPVLSGTAASAGAHTHNFLYNNKNYTGFPYSKTAGGYINFYGGNAEVSGTTNDNIRTTIASSGAHTHTVSTTASDTDSTGSGMAFTNLQPYITVYMYKRVG